MPAMSIETAEPPLRAEADLPAKPLEAPADAVPPAEMPVATPALRDEPSTPARASRRRLDACHAAGRRGHPIGTRAGRPGPGAAGRKSNLICRPTPAGRLR